MNTEAKHYYSASHNAFFLGSLIESYREADYWPDDAIAVDEPVFMEFACKIPPEGKRRIAGTDGLPAWGDIPAPTPVQLKQQAESEKRKLMYQATNAIAPLQYAVDLKMATDGEQAALTEWKKYCVLLNRLDCSAEPDIDWPKAPK